MIMQNNKIINMTSSSHKRQRSNSSTITEVANQNMIEDIRTEKSYLELLKDIFGIDLCTRDNAFLSDEEDIDFIIKTSECTMMTSGMIAKFPRINNKFFKVEYVGSGVIHRVMLRDIDGSVTTEEIPERDAAFLSNLMMHGVTHAQIMELMGDDTIKSAWCVFNFTKEEEIDGDGYEVIAYHARRLSFKIRVQDLENEVMVRAFIDIRDFILSHDDQSDRNQVAHKFLVLFSVLTQSENFKMRPETFANLSHPVLISTVYNGEVRGMIQAFSGFQLRHRDVEDVINDKDIPFEMKACRLGFEGVTNLYGFERNATCVYLEKAKGVTDWTPVPILSEGDLNASSGGFVIMTNSATGPFNSQKIRTEGIRVVNIPKPKLGNRFRTSKVKGSLLGDPKLFTSFTTIPVPLYQQALRLVAMSPAEEPKVRRQKPAPSQPLPPDAFKISRYAKK
eukprot:GHVR01124480.1.p1 GENE.GHVR01124480.1~~GHVR01124480.1.p1  ORF type:complete len:449 (+),score=57.79 GHVR01124480.1:1352-2698(+)